MQSMKFLILATMVMVLGVVSVSGQAQKRVMGKKGNPLPMPTSLQGKYVTEINGIQMSEGTIAVTEFSGSSQFIGWNSYGQTTGDLNGHFFLSVNYTVPTVGPGDAIGTDPPLGNSQITGGSWTKLIYVDGAFMGSISGRIIGGSMAWDPRYETAKVSIEMAGETGTGLYEGNSGFGSFRGKMDRTNPTVTIAGSLTLNY
jgi:hypothetical protein